MHEVAYEVAIDGVVIAGAYPHPRIEGAWIAVVPRRDFRDSGLKRFKARRGAVAFVDRRMAERATGRG